MRGGFPEVENGMKIGENSTIFTSGPEGLGLSVCGCASVGGYRGIGWADEGKIAAWCLRENGGV